MKTVKQSILADKTIRTLANGTLWVGVDAHKVDYHVALWSEEGGSLRHWVQPADPQLLCKSLEPIAGKVAKVVYEAGPTGFGLARELSGHGLCVMVVAPSHIPTLPGKQPKSDSLDCRKLAMMAAKGLLRAVYVPSEQQEADRQVVRLREQFVRKLRRVKHNIKSFLLQHGIAEPAGLADWSKKACASLRELALSEELRFCLDQLLDELDWLQKRVLHVTRQVRELAKNERHKQAFDCLTSTPGVGLVTAMTIRSELLAPERFERGEQVARVIGLAPQVRQSGQSQWNGSLMKSGNPRMRTVLVEASWRWIRLDPWAQAQYRRLLANTGSAKKAIVAMARKLAIRLWRIMTRCEPYRMAAC